MSCSLVTVNVASTSRTHASVSHSSAEAELYAMTQASVSSLAIKNFIQEIQAKDSFEICQGCGQDRFFSKQNNGITFGHLTKSKHVELKASMSSRYSQ